MTSTKYQAVMFDMDGLLLDTERMVLGCFIKTARHFGLSEDPALYYKCIGHSRAKSNSIIQHAFKDQLDLRSFNSKWDELVAERFSGDIPMRPGVEVLFQILVGKGVRLGVATSTESTRANAQLDRCGLLQHLEHLVGGDMVKNHKPNSEPYLKLASLMGVSASNCIAFEDSNTGTQAAIASGATTVQVPDLVQPSDEILKFGHTIAPSLLEGAMAVGLIEQSDL